ncbi:MAG: ATPase [Acidobacteria bacterium]|jgi:MoxR-like ATPase|nr:ATPase [Acidobacteriota bacterium]
MSDHVRERPEVEFASELDRLEQVDEYPRPARWRLSPRAVATYLLGGKLPDGSVITPKYVGSRNLIEVAVATLATDRALLLLGLPGTAKTWVAEHLAAAICGDSTLLVQGTAGTTEETLRYGWNYATLLARGPVEEALVPGPVMRAMRDGKLVRVEELTRIPTDVEDSLITILSEKVLPIPELNQRLEARRGFNLIATANSRDRGVNQLSGALRRRFNTVILPVPATIEDEIEIVERRVAMLGRELELPVEMPVATELRRVVTIFRELRAGETLDGRTRIRSLSGTLSPAEAIAVIGNGLTLAAHFGEGGLRPTDIAAALHGVVIRDPGSDPPVWREYLENVVRNREGWEDLYQALRERLD